MGGEVLVLVGAMLARFALDIRTRRARRGGIAPGEMTVVRML
jgi:hypothetical protein